MIAAKLIVSAGALLMGFVFVLTIAEFIHDKYRDRKARKEFEKRQERYRRMI